MSTPIPPNLLMPEKNTPGLRGRFLTILAAAPPSPGPPVGTGRAVKEIPCAPGWRRASRDASGVWVGPGLASQDASGLSVARLSGIVCVCRVLSGSASAGARERQRPSPRAWRRAAGPHTTRLLTPSILLCPAPVVLDRHAEPDPGRSQLAMVRRGRGPLGVAGDRGGLRRYAPASLLHRFPMLCKKNTPIFLTPT